MLGLDILGAQAGAPDASRAAATGQRAIAAGRRAIAAGQRASGKKKGAKAAAKAAQAGQRAVEAGQRALEAAQKYTATPRTIEAPKASGPMRERQELSPVQAPTAHKPEPTVQRVTMQKPSMVVRTAPSTALSRVTAPRKMKVVGSVETDLTDQALKWAADEMARQEALAAKSANEADASADEADAVPIDSGSPPPNDGGGSGGGGSSDATGSPSISGVAPSSGMPGDIVTLTGTHLTGATSAAFGGVAAAVTVLDDSHATVQVPQGAVTGPITITTSKGPATAPGTFTVNPPYADAGGGGGFGGGGGGGGGGFGGGGGGGGFGDAGDVGDAGDDASGEAAATNEAAAIDVDRSAFDSEDTADVESTVSDSGDSDLPDDQSADEYGDQVVGLRGIDIIGASRGVFVGAGQTIIGMYDLGQATRQMDSLKQVPLGVAEILARRGQVAINTALANAKQPWYRPDLPGDTARDNVHGHLQWHADALAKLTGNPQTTMYDSAADLKHWVLQAYVEQNASEEGAAAANAVLGQAWGDYKDMWVEIGEFIATLPKEIIKAAGGVVKMGIESVLGVPIWVLYLSGAVVVGALGFGVYKVLAAPVTGRIAERVVTKSLGG